MIQVTNLKKTYDTGSFQVFALRGVDFKVENGEFVAVMGASGSGKSTLMNVLGCLDQSSQGNYFLDGSDVSQMSQKSLASVRNKKIGFVFQSFNLLPKLTALQNVELPMIYAGANWSLRREKAEKALIRVGLGDRFNHKPNELSGGQKQRVAIARSLVNDPVILLADEPTGNLDSTSTVEIMGIFQDLNDEGATIVMVTHEPEVAAHTKRIITFKDGLIMSDKMVENRSIVRRE